MKTRKTEYAVINVFSETNEAQRKQKINTAIRNLCLFDIEKRCDLDYNVDVAFHGSVPDPEKGGTPTC